ncbi:unnamed protein product [Nezara viridula]|uniref:Cytochrome b561 domain-containing protein n=1 Tax=Nezara viridula TaxID=85310 RepID=A0A9P0H9W2_NEZVI|nr:unnamed protein product [Nezara viridula]
MEGTAIAKYVIFGFAQCCGLTAFFIIIAVLSNCGSIDWSRSLNVHAFCMFFGMVYLQGMAISSFRVLTFVDRTIVKLIHVAVNAGALIVTLVGIIAILSNRPTFSLHGVIGMITFLLFAIQWFSGFFSFLYPKLEQDTRAAMIPYHRAGGAVIFGLTIVTAVVGIHGYATFSKLICFSYGRASDYSDEMIAAGVFTLVYGLLSVILVQAKVFKRS